MMENTVQPRIFVLLKVIKEVWKKKIIWLNSLEVFLEVSLQHWQDIR